MTQTRSRLRDVVVDCARPSALAAFWAEVLGYRVRPYDDAEIARLRAAGIDDLADDPTVPIDPPDGGPSIFFVRVPEPNFVDGVRNQEVLDAIARADATKKWIDVEPGL